MGKRYRMDLEKLKLKLKELAKDENSYRELLELFDLKSEIKKENGAFDLSCLNDLTTGNENFFWRSSVEQNEEIIHFTDSVKKFTGYSGKEINELPGKKFSLIYKDDYLTLTRALTEFEKDVSQKYFTMIYRLISKNNKRHWVKEMISVIRDSDGKIKQYFGYVTDISELKEKETLLLESKENLLQLNYAKDRFISLISHDLRAPFTSILGFSEILLNDQELPLKEKQEYLTYIYESSVNQLQLINYLLDWSRLQTGKIKVELKRLKIKNIINECVSLLTGNAIRKNIDIKTDVDEDVYLLADERLITQAIMNLLSNAIKFTPNNKSVSVKVGKFKEGTYEVVVRDEGVGISEANKEKIFKFEHKLTTTGTHGEKGSGLGLTLVKEIVDRHGGEIWFYSESGEGSEFHFTLDEAKNIFLLVEDDKSDRTLYNRVVKKNYPDAEIIQANNGFEAISLVAKKIPSFVITDHDMPLMNGLQLIESLRNMDETSGVQAIVIAANLSDELRAKYLDLGVEAIIDKPVEVKSLGERLKSIVL